MTDEEPTGGHSDSSADAVPALAGSLAGAAGAALALGFGELMDGAFDSIPSMVVAISELLSDYTPGDIVAFSIANIGTSQKTLLTAGIIVATLVLGGLLGRFAARGQPRATVAGFALLGLFGGWATARNPLSPAFGSWVVALVATALAAGGTLLLVSLAVRRRPVPAVMTEPDEPWTPPEGLEEPWTPPEGQEEPWTPPEGQEEPAGWGVVGDLKKAGARPTPRRAFFVYAGGAGAAALGMVGLGRALRGQSEAEQFLATNSLRSATTTTTTTTPRPTAAAPPTTIEQGAAPQTTTTTTAAAPPAPPTREQLAALDTLDGDVAGISSYVTPNDSFYRIDTAFGRVPQVDPAGWRLRFTGMVDNPYELTFDEIQAMDLSDHVITLSCVSNEVGGDLVGNAAWTGVPLSVLLDRAGVQAGADQVVGRSVDHWTAGFPTPLVYDGRNAILAIGMNDEFLPTDHGFPARLVVAGLYGYVSAVKWVNEIHLTTWDGFDGYWVPRGWSKEGPMKTQSRIDVPADGSRLDADRPTSIAGVAWAPTRGIERVEVSIDDGEWLPCALGEALGDESWVQWRREWTPASGRHQMQVRATDGNGITQGGRKVSPRPNGAEGWHTITVTVGT